MENRKIKTSSLSDSPPSRGGTGGGVSPIEFGSGVSPIETTLKPEVGFSGYSIAMLKFQSEVEAKRGFGKTLPFPERECTPEKQKERIAKAISNFWFFDKIYFDKKLYSDGFSKPSGFHKDLLKFAQSPGVHIVLGARKHGKTATAKKILIWLILTGRITHAGTLSSTMPVSMNILADIYYLIKYNAKINFDFKPEFLEENKIQLEIKILNSDSFCRISAYSEGTSIRGASEGFNRPQFVLCDDFETRLSPLGSNQVDGRIKYLREAFQSLSKDGTLFIAGNNFDERCAFNKLLKEQVDGILPNKWHVHKYPAWNNGPLWPERYPAKTEAELQYMLDCADTSEWSADFQQEPCPPDGFIFTREHLNYYSELPKDSRGVLYVDENLSKKEKGDTTASVALLYSPHTDRYYVDAVICHSYSDANILLEDTLEMKTAAIRGLGFDGNVSQESTWTQHVRNFCKIKKIPYPTIIYCRYHVDELAKNTQTAWNEDRILINEKIKTSKDGQRFLSQLFSFQGKSKNKADDAPDALICAFELIHERQLGKKFKTEKPISSIKDYYF